MSGYHRQSQALGEVWELLQRYRARFILPAFLTMVAVLVTGALLPRKYQGEAIFERRNDMVLTEMTNRGASQTFQSPRASAAEEIVGQPAIDQLITAIQPELSSGRLGRHTAADPSGLRADLQRMLLVRYDISSAEVDRIRVSYTAVNPELARVVVNTLVKHYIEHTRASMDSRLKQSAEFFNSEVEREHTAIESLENQMLSFEISHAEMLPDSPTNLQMMITQAQSEASDLEQKLRAATLREKALIENLAITTETTPSVTTGPNPQYDRLDDKLHDLESQLTTDVDVLKMTDKHPDLIALRGQIARLKEQLATMPRQAVKETQTSANPKHAETEMMLSTARADRQSLETQAQTAKERLARLSGQSASLFPVRADYRKLSRDVEQHRRQLSFWEDNLRRVRMALAAESGNRGVQLDFIKPCGRIGRPVSPNLMQVLAAALGLGALAGAAGVFLAQRSDESYSDPEILAQATRLPLLGSVSEILTQSQRRLRRLRLMVLFPLNALALTSVVVALAGVLYLSLERPDKFAELKQNPAQFLLGGRSADAAAAPDARE